MLMIRLQRVGRIHEPTFRVVLVDSKRGPKSGQFLEVLGNHDTRKAKNNSHMETERIKFWISKGAQLSDTMKNLLITKKIITGKKVNALPKKRPIKKEVTSPEKTSAEVLTGKEEKKATEEAAKPKVEEKKEEAPAPQTPAETK